MLEVNLTAQFVLARELGRDMVERGQREDRLRRVAALVPGRHHRAGLHGEQVGGRGSDEGARERVGGHGVNVNAVAPGYVRTDNTQALRDDPERYAADPRAHPRRPLGRAEDIAGAFVFLCSSAADYVHGVVLPVDGGWLGR